jgi:hypothetical protein
VGGVSFYPRARSGTDRTDSSLDLPEADRGRNQFLGTRGQVLTPEFNFLMSPLWRRTPGDNASSFNARIYRILGDRIPFAFLCIHFGTPIITIHAKRIGVEECFGPPDWRSITYALSIYVRVTFFSASVALF